MKKNYVALFTATAILFAGACGEQKNETPNEQKTENKSLHQEMIINTADEALNELINGNQRFLDGKMINTNYKEEIEATKSGQHPHSVILSCEDSRVPPEIIFDQGIGHIFVNRVAGNVEDVDMLGSMEYAVKIVGSKLIVVMGHKSCGAIHGAIDDVHLGNLTNLLSVIRPAITGDTLHMEEMLDETSKNNVKMTIGRILKESIVISDLVKEDKIKIVGAWYDVTNGQVIFFK
jgi:carbonic anhydrase